MLKLRYCKLPHRSKAQKGKIIVETSVSGVSSVSGCFISWLIHVQPKKIAREIREKMRNNSQNGMKITLAGLRSYRFRCFRCYRCFSVSGVSGVSGCFTSKLIFCCPQNTRKTRNSGQKGYVRSHFPWCFKCFSVSPVSGVSGCFSS